MVNWPGSVVHSDAIESERAAFSEAELTRLLQHAGLDDLEHLRSRPLGEHQVHWAPGRGGRRRRAGLWRDVPLPSGTALLTRMALQSFPRSLTRS